MYLLAGAGEDRNAVAGDTINLIGASCSDADGESLSYNWTLTSPDGSTANLMSRTAMETSFVADIAGKSNAELIVNDGTDINAEKANTYWSGDFTYMRN